MKYLLEMGPGFERNARELGSMGKAMITAAGKGLERGSKDAADHVVADKLSGQKLNRRTGNLARSTDAWMKSPLHAVVGVREDSPVGKYAWLLGDERKTITPNRGKYLAIPAGENLTGAGVGRYSSPRDVEDGFFVRSGGALLFGRKNGSRGKFRLMFVMKRSVTIQGSDALAEGVSEKIDDITDTIQQEIDKEIGN